GKVDGTGANRAGGAGGGFAGHGYGAPVPGPAARVPKPQHSPDASSDAGPAEAGAGAQRIQAVDRAIALLKSVAASSTPPTVLELARACGINRSTAWRLLRTLEHH